MARSFATHEGVMRHYSTFLRDEVRKQLPGATDVEVYVQSFSEGRYWGNPLNEKMAATFTCQWQGVQWGSGVDVYRHMVEMRQMPEYVQGELIKSVVQTRRVMRGWLRKRLHGKKLWRSMRMWGSHGPA